MFTSIEAEKYFLGLTYQQETKACLITSSLPVDKGKRGASKFHNVENRRGKTENPANGRTNLKKIKIPDLSTTLALKQKQQSNFSVREG